ncbi:MAG TPA: hypothetical protein VFV33_08105, partial [Gemmatimonadaceae bacterium]|nr:hypothetical protein [Gemmatimonadaceae bacterium]
LVRRLALEPSGELRPRRASGAPPLMRHSPPATGAQLVGFAHVVASYGAFLLRRGRFREQWALAWARDASDSGRGGVAPGDLSLGDPSARVPQLDLSRYRPLIPPPDRFWADPFPLRVGGREYVLFEELRYEDGVGYLVAVEMGADGPAGEPVTVLRRPYHLSYPFVFEYGGETWLIPETAEEGRLELYRATRAPFEWTLDRVLLEGPGLVDATIEEIDGRWWMFACEYRPGRWAWTDLVLFHAESPLGPWHPHPRNPVFSDARVARPAGRLFRHGGSWIRPAQDCSRTYGGALSLRRIVTLSLTDYEEEEVSQLEAGPAPGRGGPHTINALGGLSVIDLKRTVRR